MDKRYAASAVVARFAYSVRRDGVLSILVSSPRPYWSPPIRAVAPRSCSIVMSRRFRFSISVSIRSSPEPFLNLLDQSISLRQPPFLDTVVLTIPAASANAFASSELAVATENRDTNHGIVMSGT